MGRGKTEFGGESGGSETGEGDPRERVGDWEGDVADDGVGEADETRESESYSDSDSEEKEGEERDGLASGSGWRGWGILGGDLEGRAL